MFADDLNVFKQFDLDTTNSDIVDDMSLCKTSVHKWGVRNRVAFDAGKEHIIIIHPQDGQGDNFKLLGCLIDVALTMNAEIDYLVSRAKPKIHALLRTRGIYSVKDMILQYKTHIWGITEHPNGCIVHATDTVLKRLDHLQTSFLSKLEIDESHAFLEYNFAPSALRRDIAVLGLLHKRVLVLAHPSFEELLPFLPADRRTHHDKMLDSRLSDCTKRYPLWSRSIFGKVSVYNLLPNYVVHLPSVSEFQNVLTIIVKQRCHNNLVA